MGSRPRRILQCISRLLLVGESGESEKARRPVRWAFLSFSICCGTKHKYSKLSLWLDLCAHCGKYFAYVQYVSKYNIWTTTMFFNFGSLEKRIFQETLYDNRIVQVCLQQLRRFFLKISSYGLDYRTVLYSSKIVGCVLWNYVYTFLVNITSIDQSPRQFVASLRRCGCRFCRCNPV